MSRHEFFGARRQILFLATTWPTKNHARVDFTFHHVTSFVQWRDAWRCSSGAISIVQDCAGGREWSLGEKDIGDHSWSLDARVGTVWFELVAKWSCKWNRFLDSFYERSARVKDESDFVWCNAWRSLAATSQTSFCHDIYLLIGQTCTAILVVTSGSKFECCAKCNTAMPCHLAGHTPSWRLTLALGLRNFNNTMSFVTACWSV